MEAAASAICESFWSRSVPAELRWLSKQIRPFFRWHLASFLCIAAGSLLGIVTPLVLGRLIDDVLPQRKLPSLVAMVFLLFVSYQGRTLLTSVGAYVNLAAAQRLALSLRLAVLRHLDQLSADYYDKTSPGTAGYALKEPIEEIAYFGSDLFPSILRMLLTLCFTLGAMLWLSPALTVVTLPLIPLFLLTRQHFRNQLIVFSNLVQSDRLTFADFLQEHLASILAIQLLARERRQERKAFLLLGQIVHSQQKVFMTGVWFTGSTSLVIVLAMCAVIGYGGWSVFAGRVTVGTLVAFYGFVTQLFDPLSSAAEMYTRTQKIFASIRQVRRIFAISPDITNCPAPICLTEDHSCQIDVVGLKFQYEGQRAKLHIPRLRILPGEQIAIAGENGAGKSTLAKLIVRIYDGASGSIRLGGVDIRSLELASLRQSVCYLPREPVLFAGTLASNLRFVRLGASPKELEEVLERVGLSAFLSMLHGDLNHEIGPAGCRLSGGQRQRLTIARALLQRPRVLILDEATSCLDPVSEELVLRNVRRHLSTSTLIVISHRLSTVSSFPRILVLSDGQIVADGNPHTLVSQCDTYSNLFSDRNANA